MQLIQILEYIAQLEEDDYEKIVYNYGFGIYDELIAELLDKENIED